MGINDLIKGNRVFREVRFPEFEEDVAALVHSGQNPEILFIGCSDSRVTPDLMLDTKPGDMFILRNMGNFVPPYSHVRDFHGNSAAIEYAVSVLEVKHIIICGHSHCGACKSLYEAPKDPKRFVHMNKWLELGKKAKEYTLLALGNTDDKELLYRTTERISILHQLENLVTFPEVAKRVREGSLTLHGWYYHIEDGSIEYYDGDACRFKPIEQSDTPQD